MKDKLTLSILILAFSLIPITESIAQSFQNIKLPKYPGIKKLERGVNPGIASGSHSGFYIRFGEDIGQLCSNFGIAEQESKSGYEKNPRFRLNIFDTQGSLESLRRLRKEDEVQLAIIQSDLWHYADQQWRQHYQTANKEERRILESWKEIKDRIALLLPLYEEKIHIVVRHENGPKGRAKMYDDLLSLFENGGARVNVGTKGSGTMVTCAVINEIITRETPNLGWKERYLPTGTALNNLLNGIDDGDNEVDAVILVGGEPFPALEKWTQEFVASHSTDDKNLFTQLFSADNTVKPRIDLLSFGNADTKYDFEKWGYRKSTIAKDKYALLRGPQAGDVETRAVTACLVTHALYNRNAGEERHKIDWIQHILYRILSKLDTTRGLNVPFPIAAGDKWVEAARNLEEMNQNPRIIKARYGWELHSDVLLREMLSKWRGSSGGGSISSTSVIIDPDPDFSSN